MPQKGGSVRFECPQCHMVLEANWTDKCEGDDGTIVEEGPLYASAQCPTCNEWRCVFDTATLGDHGVSLDDPDSQNIVGS